MTNIGHHVRPHGDSVVIGTGGARDVVASLVFGARSVTGIEINRQILDIVNGRFGDYSGHLDRNPRVTFVNDEARSYLTRTDRRYDFIQISLIDTWAATAAGAFVLTENSLYTVEAWTTFLKRLTDGGLLSVCRWSMESQPAEVYRLLSLAAAALEANGVKNPREHLVLVRATPVNGISIATLLVSRTPISRADLDVLARTTDELKFEMMMSPDVVDDPILAKIASPTERRDVLASFPLDLSAPTDDRPFFFQMLRMRDFFRIDRIVGSKLAANLEAVLVLGTLLGTVIGLSALCIFLPLYLTAERAVLRGHGALLGFFTSIGLGFMAIETAQMQRLIVALGHPTYGLTVVLFALLLSSGLGSYLTAGISQTQLATRGTRRLVLLVALLAVIGFLTPPLMRGVEAASTSVRIAIAVLTLLPMGAFMGMAFPLGMKLAARSAANLTPWLWGVNGAMSVSASVLAISVALATSISTAYWVGVVAYVGAILSWWSATRPRTTQGG